MLRKLNKVEGEILKMEVPKELFFWADIKVDLVVEIENAIEELENHAVDLDQD